jgi:hypothetical protein
VVKKADTASTSSVKVNSPLSSKDLVHMVDVSVASKYGADLTQFTRVIAEHMRSTLDTFKQHLNSNLPRQIRMVVQQIHGETQGKRVDGSAATPNLNTTTGQSSQGVLANIGQTNHVLNPNLQQPFYQTAAYGPGIPPSGNGTFQ